jgi:hypothetical protein
MWLDIAGLQRHGLPNPHPRGQHGVHQVVDVGIETSPKRPPLRLSEEAELLLATASARLLESGGWVKSTVVVDEGATA